MHWQKLLSEIKDPPPATHPLVALIESTLVADDQELLKELMHSDELEAYCRCKAANIIAMEADLIEKGTDPHTAHELALDSELPKGDDSDPTYQYEIDGAADEQADALSKYLENN